MEKLKYEFTEDEINFLIQSLDQVQVKGLQAISFLLNVVQKLQNPINKKEYDEAKAKQITEQLVGKNQEKPSIKIPPEEIKKAEEIMKKAIEQKKSNPEIKRK